MFYGSFEIIWYENISRACETLGKLKTVGKYFCDEEKECVSWSQWWCSSFHSLSAFAFNLKLHQRYTFKHIPTTSFFSASHRIMRGELKWKILLSHFNICFHSLVLLDTTPLLCRFKHRSKRRSRRSKAVKGDVKNINNFSLMRRWGTRKYRITFN